MRFLSWLHKLWQPKTKAYVSISKLEIDGKPIEFAEAWVELDVFDAGDMDDYLISSGLLKHHESITFTVNWEHTMKLLRIHDLDKQELRELRTNVIRDNLFDVDAILGLPIETPLQFKQWCEAMRTGELPAARVLVEAVEREMRLRNMRFATAEMPRLKPRSLVFQGTKAYKYGSSRHTQC